MSNVTSFAELDGEHAELLPERTVMTTFRVDPSLLSEQILPSANNNFTCMSGTSSGNTAGSTMLPSCQSIDSPGAQPVDLLGIGIL